MESGVSSSMEFKEPDKCDNKNILLLSGGKTGGRQMQINDGKVTCDSTTSSGSSNSSATQQQQQQPIQDQVNDKKEAEKMTVDEASCG